MVRVSLLGAVAHCSKAALPDGWDPQLSAARRLAAARRAPQPGPQRVARQSCPPPRRPTHSRCRVSSSLSVKPSPPSSCASRCRIACGGGSGGGGAPGEATCCWPPTEMPHCCPARTAGAHLLCVLVGLAVHQHDGVAGAGLRGQARGPLEGLQPSLHWGRVRTPARHRSPAASGSHRAGKPATPKVPLHAGITTLPPKARPAQTGIGAGRSRQRSAWASERHRRDLLASCLRPKSSHLGVAG